MLCRTSSVSDYSPVSDQTRVLVACSISGDYANATLASIPLFLQFCAAAAVCDKYRHSSDLFFETRMCHFATSELHKSNGPLHNSSTSSFIPISAQTGIRLSRWWTPTDGEIWLSSSTPVITCFVIIYHWSFLARCRSYLQQSASARHSGILSVSTSLESTPESLTLGLHSLLTLYRPYV